MHFAFSMQIGKTLKLKRKKNGSISKTRNLTPKFSARILIE